MNVNHFWKIRVPIATKLILSFLFIIVIISAVFYAIAGIGIRNSTKTFRHWSRTCVRCAYFFPVDGKGGEIIIDSSNIKYKVVEKDHQT
ncbi:hypothetical protein AMJ86_04670 [bacterium SM23_57]|nr:MAG: hypothetical protein AMJ86_04670 [bacterium SM23_57]